jgi:hypothetical protein
VGCDAAFVVLVSGELDELLDPHAARPTTAARMAVVGSRLRGERFMVASSF